MSILGALPPETVAAAHGLRDQLAEGNAASVAHIRLGNGTMANLAMLPLLDELREWRAWDLGGPGAVVVWGRSAYPLQFGDGYLDATYVAEKWTKGSICDGVALGEVLAFVLDREPPRDICGCGRHVPVYA